MNLTTYPCDANRLENLLCGELSGDAERELTAHLDVCPKCRQQLEQLAAQPSAWDEVAMLLTPQEYVYDTPGRRAPQSLHIQQVTDALAPTDDPQMLGRLGGHEISGVIGAGAMGVVLKGVDTSLDRTVAIKVMSPHLASHGAARRRFAREAKAAAAVLHPNVMAIHSVSNDEQLPYLVMPYLRGASLQKRLDDNGPLPVEEILRVGSQIAHGLQAAHSQGLVHRDIKPANILLEDGVERVAITDFGLARAVDDATMTCSGAIAGTPQYMSPEQARGEAIDQRSDLFSLGSVLYAMCTGRPPFRAETSFGVLRRITDTQPRGIREINPDIPEWLCQIIDRLLEKRPADRFHSSGEVAELLEACLAHVQQPTTVPLPGAAERPAQSPTTATQKGSLGAWLYRPTSRIVIFIMAALCGIGALGMIAWKTTNPPDISGRWVGEGWGNVVLKKQTTGDYTGTYDDTYGDELGTIELTWSRAERRFIGTWRERRDRFGKISVRLTGDEIRGAWTTNKRSAIKPGIPELADLHWSRVSSTPGTMKHGAIVSLENRARNALFIDIDGDTGDLIPLHKYTGFGGCDWVLHDVGSGYFALQNRYSDGYLDVDGETLGPVGMHETYTPDGRGCDWRFVRIADDHYKIVNRFWTDVKGKEVVLDIDGETNIPILAPYSDGGGCDWKIRVQRAGLDDGGAIVRDRRLFHVDTQTGRTTHLPESIWKGPVVLTGHGDSLYAIELGKLFRVAPSDGDVQELTGSTWHSPSAFLSHNEWLYAIDQGKLYKINPNDGKAETLCEATWQDPVSMAGIGESLYLTQSGKLFRIDLATGRKTEVGRRWWNGGSELTALNETLYAVKDGKIFQFDPQRGKRSQLTQSTWSGRVSLCAINSELGVMSGGRLYRVNPQDGQAQTVPHLTVGLDSVFAVQTDSLYVLASSMSPHLLRPSAGSDVLGIEAQPLRGHAEFQEWLKDHK